MNEAVMPGNIHRGKVPKSKDRSLRMRPCILIQPLIILVAVFAACPASAQVYKWVDESGITNYSSKPPTDPKAAKKLELVVAKAAVDKSNQAEQSILRTAQAAPADVRGNPQYLLDRINNLERQVQAERQARQYESELQESRYAADLQAQQYAAQAAVAPPPAAYDPCLESGYEGCRGEGYNYGVYYPWPVAAVVPVYHRPRPLIRTIPVTRMLGVIRGTAFTTMHNRVISSTPTSGRGAGRGHPR